MLDNQRTLNAGHCVNAICKLWDKAHLKGASSFSDFRITLMNCHNNKTVSSPGSQTSVERKARALRCFIKINPYKQCYNSSIKRSENSLHSLRDMDSGVHSRVDMMKVIAVRWSRRDKMEVPLWNRCACEQKGVSDERSTPCPFWSHMFGHHLTSLMAHRICL